MARPTSRSLRPTQFTFLGDDGGLDTKQYPKDISENPNGIGRDDRSFHIDYLKSQLIKDVARPNMFKVQIKPPDLIYKKNEFANGSKMITALAKRASFPQISIREYVLERAGQKLHIPTNEMDYGTVSITFINDSDFVLRSIFNNWQRLAIHNWQENKGSVPLLALDSTVSIHQYDTKQKEVYSIKLTNAWPQTISQIDLSQDSENQLEEFTVDFKFTMHNIYKAYK